MLLNHTLVPIYPGPLKASLGLALCQARATSASFAVSHESPSPGEDPAILL